MLQHEVGCSVEGGKHLLRHVGEVKHELVKDLSEVLLAGRVGTEAHGELVRARAPERAVELAHHEVLRNDGVLLRRHVDLVSQEAAVEGVAVGHDLAGHLGWDKVAHCKPNL